MFALLTQDGRSRWNKAEVATKREQKNKNKTQAVGKKQNIFYSKLSNLTTRLLVNSPRILVNKPMLEFWRLETSPRVKQSNILARTLFESNKYKIKKRSGEN